MGAVALRRNKIVGTGFNYVNSESIKVKYSGLHAEIAAVLKANGPVDTIFVVRINRKNELRCSKPCDACMKFLKKNNVKKIFYIAQDGDIEKLSL